MPIKRKKNQPQEHKRSKREEELFNNLLKVTYEFIKSKNYLPHTKVSLIERLKIHPDHFAIFDNVLKDLKDKGSVEEAEDLYHHKDKKPGELIKRGILHVHHRGFGFVETGADDQDVFIPKPCMNDAIEGDIVDVLINTRFVSERGPEGRILAIIERKKSQLVGIVKFTSKSNYFAYCPVLGEEDLALISSISNGETLVVGDRVLLDVESWGSKGKSTITKLNRKLGHIKDPKEDVNCAILEYEIRKDFPEPVLEEVRQYGTKVTASDLKNREDLRKLECFTIDPDTAKDFDDALSLYEEDDHYILGVHIADVSHYVKKLSFLDEEARKRCNSTYFPGTCVPMLPPELCENLCSLREGVIRLTSTLIIKIDREGTIVDFRITRAAIKSAKRFTYKEAKQVLDGKLKSKHSVTLKKMVELCYLLKKKRAERGSVELYMPELVVKIDQDGVPYTTEVVQYDITHQLVEEFMLLANELVATHLSKQGKFVTYRVHEEPAKENLREFSVLVSAYGYTLPKNPTPQDIQKFFVSIEGSPFAQYLATCYIRSMRLACYSADNIGHYGLSLTHYCHFTSPIRRYVDLIAHRVLFGEDIDKETITSICKEASDKERISARAEGSVLSLKKLRYLEVLSKRDRKNQYKAIITRVKPFGIYFDIVELMLEGFLHISELDNDYFHFFESDLVLEGSSTGISYRAGDSIFVRLVTIDFIKKEATWSLVVHHDDNESEQLKNPKKKKRSRKKR